MNKLKQHWQQLKKELKEAIDTGAIANDQAK